MKIRISKVFAVNVFLRSFVEVFEFLKNSVKIAKKEVAHIKTNF